MIAENFLGSHGLAHGDLGQGHGADPGHDADHAHGAGADTGDMAGGFDDIGADFDDGSFDI